MSSWTWVVDLALWVIVVGAGTAVVLDMLNFRGNDEE